MLLLITYDVNTGNNDLEKLPNNVRTTEEECKIPYLNVLWIKRKV